MAGSDTERVWQSITYTRNADDWGFDGGIETAGLQVLVLEKGGHTRGMYQETSPAMNGG